MMYEAEKIFISELYKLSSTAQDFARKLLAEFRANKVDETTDNENLQGEIWRDVVGFEGLYQIRNFGRVNGLRWTDES